MATIVPISDNVHLVYNKIFEASDDGEDVTGEQYLILDFIYHIDGEMIHNLTAQSKHQFSQCNPSSIRRYIEEDEPLRLDIMIDPEDAENDTERISVVVSSLVGQCVGVYGLKKLLVEVIVEVNQEEEYELMVESNDDVEELVRTRRVDMLAKYVCGGGMKNDCVICLSEMRAGENIACTPCVHWFHEDCIERWFAKAGNCPLCRSKIDHV